MESIGLPVNLVTFAALLTVVFLLGRHTVKGTVKIFVRGAVLLVGVLLAIHFLSESNVYVLDQALNFLQQNIPSMLLD